MMPKAWRKRLGWFLVGVAGFSLVVYFSGLEDINSLMRADPRFAAGVFIAVTAVTLTSSFRLASITDSIVGRRALSFRQYYAALVTSRVLGLFLPRSASEVGVPFTTLTVVGKTTPEAAAASITLDRLFDLTLLVLWLAPALLILLGIVPPSAGVFLFPLVGVATFMAAIRLQLLVARTARALSIVADGVARPPALRRFFRARAENLLEVGRADGLSPARAAAMASLTLTRYLLNTVLLFFVAEAFGLEISFYTLLLSGAIMQLSQLLAFTPGGLGVVEAGSAAGLVLAGVDGGAIAAFLVGQRVFQYTCFPVLGGLVALAMLWNPGGNPGDAPAPAPGDQSPPRARVEELGKPGS